MSEAQSIAARERIKKARASFDGMITRSQIRREFRLTDSLIKKIGKPDATATNPKYPSAGAKMQLFKRTRVEKFCQTHRADIDASKRRKGAAAKAVKTKGQQTEEIIENACLEIRELPETYSELLTIARRHAEDRHGHGSSEPGWNGACATVRHEFSNYEQVLNEIKGRVGKNDAYTQLRGQFNTEIEAAIIAKYGAEAENARVAQSPSRRRSLVGP